MKYAKELENGEPVYKMLIGIDGAGRKAETYDWGVDEFISYCLYPLSECIETMRKMDAEEDSDLSRYANILARLYDAAHMQLEKMGEAIYKDMGWIQIRTTSERCLGDFLLQDFLEVYVKKEQATGDFPEMDRDEREKINQKGDKTDIGFVQKAFTLACVEKEEWKKKFEEAEKARLIVSRKLSYYVSEEAAGRLHIDPISKGANLRKTTDTGKKDRTKLRRAT